MNDQTNPKALRRSSPMRRPLKILQFGEGNFLRAFIDWMVQGLNDAGLFDGAVRLVQPIPNGMAKTINDQSGLYTVLLRGVEHGRTIRSTTLVESVSGCIDPYENWDAVVEDMRCETLRFIVSNTTETGIRYRAEPFRPGSCPDSFPAKLTSLLFERFQAFGSTPGRGLIVLPCELIENNGTTLKNCVLRYAEDWNLGEKFIRWIETENVFLNTLVDRIVTGFPAGEYESLCREFGYDDRLIVCGEPFHFFAIESPPEAARILDTELPLVRVGFNVVVTENIKPYRDRKVRFLNGAHTALAPAALIAGLSFVHEAVADPVFSTYLRRLLFDEISPTVDLPETEKRRFAESVLERFSNPFLSHRLSSIALNCVSKWSVRVLPSLRDSFEAKKSLQQSLPKLLPFSLAALVVFYRNKNGVRPDGHVLEDDPEIVRYFQRIWDAFETDHDFHELAENVLRTAEFRDAGISTIAGLAQRLARHLEDIERFGIRETLSRLLETTEDRA